MTVNFPSLNRDDFFNAFKLAWHVGQHVTLVGTTGDGKTKLTEHLCNMRKYCVVVATKKSDKSLDEYGKSFVRRETWPPDFNENHVIYWTRPKELGEFGEQRVKVYNALASIYLSGGWTCCIDDVFYVSKTLHLESVIQMMYTQVRSQDVSLIGNIQRPAWVPVEVLSQSTHMLIFGLHNENDVETSAKEQGVKPALLKEAVSQLKQYEFVWVRKRHPIVIIRK